MLPSRWIARLLAAGCGCAAPLCAWSQASPYELSVFQTVTYQPNVFQVADGDARTRDFISSTGVSFGITSVQENLTMFANGNAQANVYQDTKALNNPSYGINLGLTSTVERLAATLRYSASQSLGDYGTPGVAPTTERNLQTNQEAALALRYRLTPRTNLVGGIGYQGLSYSASAFDAQESSSGVATIDLTHQLNPEMTVGGGIRYSNGVTPRYATGPTPGSFIADRFDGNYLDLLFSWQPASIHVIRARLSLTRTVHSQATQLDFTGLTGGISWTYTPSERLSLFAALTQNTGSGPSLFSPVAQSTGGGTGGTGGTGSGTGGGSTGSTGGTGAGGPGAAPVVLTDNNNRLNTTLTLSGTYQATRTISVNGNLSVNNGDLVDSAGASGNAWTSTLGLGIVYVPTRSISLNCAISVALQSASQGAQTADLASSYRSPTTSCTGTFSFF